MAGDSTKPLNNVVLYVFGGIVVFLVAGYVLDAYIFTELLAFVRGFFK
jgi:hypothetical protein